MAFSCPCGSCGEAAVKLLSMPFNRPTLLAELECRCCTGNLHRDDGPALEYADGHKEWWRDNQRHRENGPAIEYANGTKEWWSFGKLHRTDGPAIEYPDGTEEWYLCGAQVIRPET